MRALVALIPSLVALGLCRVPGFDLLDYHACLALGPVVGFSAAHLVVERGRWPHWLLLSVGPAVILLGNSLWVPNCAPGVGLVFYALGPLSSAVVGACLGSLSVALAPRWPRRLLWGVGLATMVPAAWHFYRHPQVFAYHGLVGWVGGALYEDALAPHATYGWFRLVDTAAWLSAAAWASLARAEGSAAARAGVLRRLWTAATDRRLGTVAAATCVAALAAGALLGEPLGWRVTSADVQRHLSGRIELRLRHLPSADADAGASAELSARSTGLGQEPADVIVHMLPRAGWRRRARLIGEDIAVRWLELRDFFGVAPQAPIEVYLYPDTSRKRRWMGAARVEMAKPWLRQVHMVWPGWGRSITRHELAHVFAGEGAPPPFAVPLRHGFWPDAVLIEGMAVAAEWPIRSGLTPHQWSAAMRRLKLAPPMARLLAPTGFFQQSSSRAYTLAGSLLRWVRATYGFAALQRVYATADLSRATGQPLPALLRAWGRAVDQAPLTADDLARARARFERPGLFFRPCSLEIGRCRERARRAWRAGDDAGALAAWAKLRQRIRAVARHQPLGLDIELSYAYALAQAGQQGAAREVLSALTAAGAPRLTALQRARVNRMLGDLDGLADTSSAAARDHWRAADAAPVSPGAHRMFAVKLHLLASDERRAARAPSRRLLRDGLLPYGPATSYTAALRRAHRALPRDPIIGYLWARRRLLGAPRAAAEVRALLPALQRWPRLWREAWHMLAKVAARRGACDDVAAAAEAVARQQGRGDRTRHVWWRAELRRRCEAMVHLRGGRERGAAGDAATSQPWLRLVGPRT